MRNGSFFFLHMKANNEGGGGRSAGVIYGQLHFHYGQSRFGITCNRLKIRTQRKRSVISYFKKGRNQITVLEIGDYKQDNNVTKKSKRSI